MALSSTLLCDFRVALALLTRLPLPLSAETFAAHKTRAFWAYPMAGLVVAGLVACVGALALWVGVPVWGVAGLMLAAQIVITGALHEDGLADSVDGLWGGWDRAHRLEIMKDSHIGSYGVLALVLSVLIRAACLAACAASGIHAVICAVMASAPLSRTACVVVMYALPHAREQGLSVSAGRPGGIHLAGAAVIGALACGLSGTIAALVLAALVTAAVIRIAQLKIGGQTGDILGATQQLTEIAVLLAVATAL